MILKIGDIVDVSIHQKLLDSFCNFAGIAGAIVDLEGNIILGSRWQKICTDFHRLNKLACQKCTESDTELANCLTKGEKFSLYRCKNGLTDAASPIIVQGQHIANAFVGQFLLNPPDLEFFKQQAKDYGFDEKEYVQALSEVPVIEEERVPVIINFLVSYAEMIASMVLKHQEQLNAEVELVKAKQDILSSKKAEQAIEADRKRLDSILDGIDDIIYVSDPETYELLHVNKPYYDKWGAGEVIGKKCHKVIHNLDEPCSFCNNNKIFGESMGKSCVWEYENKFNKAWYRCSGKAIEWVDGRLVRFEIAADITQLKFLEEELKNSNVVLERSNKELEQFAYVASHDLQEPLRMVASYTQLLAKKYKDKLDAKADKYIGYAVEGSQRMQVLINNLLMLSRVNTRGVPFEPVDCNKVLETVLHGLGRIIKEKHAQIEVGPLPTIMADSGQLSQLFQNLIGNGIKFHDGDERPVVTVDATQEGSEWVFSIKDNGIGIDPQFFDRIFVIFQRLHNRTSYEGTGIGLAIAKKIVERHGGKIWVESEPDKGTTFYFSLKDSQEKF